MLAALLGNGDRIERAAIVPLTILNAPCSENREPLADREPSLPNDQAHLSAPGGRIERNQREQ